MHSVEEMDTFTTSQDSKLSLGYTPFSALKELMNFQLLKKYKVSSSLIFSIFVMIVKKINNFRKDLLKIIQFMNYIYRNKLLITVSKCISFFKQK